MTLQVYSYKYMEFSSSQLVQLKSNMYFEEKSNNINHIHLLVEGLFKR